MEMTGMLMEQRSEAKVRSPKTEALNLSRQHGIGTLTHISYPSTQETEVIEYSFQHFVNAVYINTNIDTEQLL